MVKKGLFCTLLLIPFWILSCIGLQAQPRVDLPDGVPPSYICVLGGTNLAMALTRHESIQGSFTIETPYGTSPKIYYGLVAEVPFYHLPMHGSISESDLSDIESNNRSLLRTWSTLYLLGIKEILGGATAGGINPQYSAGDWIIPHDFIDWNVSRPRSIVKEIMRDEEAFILPRLVPATDPHLDSILTEETIKVAGERRVHAQGVIAQAAGGRFETVSEIRMMQLMGCDLVTMTVASEITYARQLGMNYSCMVGIVNPAEGLGEWTWNNLTELYPKLHTESIQVLLNAIPKVKALQGKPRAADALRIHPDFEEQ